MTYDPFARGPHPVGVRTVDLTDASRSRWLPTEVWYPATAAHAGKDTAAETRDKYDLLPGFPPLSQSAVRDAEAERGKYPLVIFSHGFGGHRRQSTFLCTHLASHGYVVAAMDHTGNTVIDMAQMTMQVMMGQPMPDIAATIHELIQARPADVRFVIDSVLAGNAGVPADFVDESRIGMSGHSFGGWTTLKTAGLERRIRAALALAPAGGPGPLPAEPLIEALDFAWGRDVPTLLLVADKDTLLPLSSMHHILGRATCTKRMIVLENADHMHFCDEVEQTHELFRSMPPPGPLADVAKGVPPISELCPGTHAYDFNNSLGLAHMDANLKGSEEAAGFLSQDLPAVFAERGIRISVV
ncbi:MAG TPA: acetylxylan esterase [Candidatus Limnocylindrales bacterium]|nr:acetylxylan esterase [Candidatus Limnocylindrales bacterium]